MKSFAPFLNRQSKVLILLLDLLVFLLTLWGIYHLRLGVGNWGIFERYDVWLVAFGVLSSLYVLGNYDLDHGISKKQLLVGHGAALISTILFVIFLNYLLGRDRSGLYGRGVLLGTLIAFFVISFCIRILASRWFNLLREKLAWLVIIDSRESIYFQADLERLGFEGRIEYFNPDIHSFSELDQKLNYRWSAIVVAANLSDKVESIWDQLMTAKFAGHSVMSLSQFYERHWLKVPVYDLKSSWFVSSDGFEFMRRPIALRVKRLMDLSFSIILLFLVWPLMLFTAIAVKLESRGPTLYRQVRSGKSGAFFTIYKFRSMTMNAESAGAQWATANDVRITKVGRIIRATRLDELPQLWNVLKGEMSFVGPRPERPEFDKMLSNEIPFYDLRYLVRPGITGWAQVLYPYGASVEDSREKLQYDLFYIKDYSLMMDIVIILKTIRVVIFGRGR